MTSPIPRRHFLATLGLTAASLGSAKLLGAELAKDNIQLGMMLQGGSATELHQKAKAIAAAGFDTVQLTFFFSPTVEELKSLARALKELKLKTVAFGTYFNLFRPDDAGFMGSSQSSMKLIATHSDLFNCKQFVTWSGSFSSKFAGEDPRNHTPEGVKKLQTAIREILIPILEPIGGRVAFEPYYPHVIGTIEQTKEVFAPFRPDQVGLMLDPPNFISPALYPKRDEEMLRLFRELGDRIHIVHFKDMKFNPKGPSVDLPGPGGGEMKYPVLISEIRKLKRPLNCIIEHINAEPAELTKTKAWVDQQLQKEY